MEENCWALTVLSSPAYSSLRVFFFLPPFQAHYTALICKTTLRQRIGCTCIPPLTVLPGISRPEPTWCTPTYILSEWVSEWMVFYFSNFLVTDALILRVLTFGVSKAPMEKPGQPVLVLLNADRASSTGSFWFFVIMAQLTLKYYTFHPYFSRIP